MTTRFRGPPAAKVAPALAFLAGLMLAPASALSQTGTIVGRVSISGTLPAPRMLEVTKNQEICGSEIEATDVVVHDGRLVNGVVFVEGLEGEVRPGEYVLSNSGCSFDPPVLAATVGGVLIVDNQDDVLHNTHLSLEIGHRSRTIGNWALSSKGSKIRADRPLRRAGIVDVECDAHPWMHAKIRIFGHPYFAVTRSAGEFEITGVPVGTHVVKVWHEVFGELEQEVTVRAGAETSADFTYENATKTGDHFGTSRSR